MRKLTHEDYRQIAAASRAAQGLPPTIQDGPTLDRIAGLILAGPDLDLDEVSA
jgi:hypothetical protein